MNNVERLTYTVAEGAYALGLSTRTVAELVARDTIHSFKVGRARRIPKSEIERIIKHGIK